MNWIQSSNVPLTVHRTRSAAGSTGYNSIVPLKTLVHVVTQDDPTRVDRIVAALGGLSRSGILGLFDHECVCVNDQPETNCLRELVPGDTVQVRFDPEQRYRPRPRAWKDSGFNIVHEDDHLLVVEKAAWILSVPTEGTSQPGDTSLMGRISAYLSRGGKPVSAHPAHRLDRGVSGLLVVAKSPQIAASLRDQFEARKPRRLYIAIARGRVDPPDGTIRSHLATGDDLSRYSTADHQRGQLAITHYRTLLHGADATLLEVELETGRRNQIRVHLAEKGHPVLGERRYQRRMASHPRWTARRLALHAAELEFIHPRTHVPMSFRSPLPGMFATFFGGRLAAKIARFQEARATESATEVTAADHEKNRPCGRSEDRAGGARAKPESGGRPGNTKKPAKRGGPRPRRKTGTGKTIKRRSR